MSDFYKGLISAPTEMTSLTEIKARLVAIEQGQGVLCERMDRILARMEEPLNISGVDREAVLESMAREKRMEKKLDCLQGKELLSQFKANGHKPKRRKR